MTRVLQDLAAHRVPTALDVSVVVAPQRPFSPKNPSEKVKSNLPQILSSIRGHFVMG